MLVGCSAGVIFLVAWRVGLFAFFPRAGSLVATENDRVYTTTREGAYGRSHKHGQGGVPLESGGSSQTPTPCPAAPPSLRRDWQTPPPQGTPFAPATGTPKGTRGL